MGWGHAGWYQPGPGEEKGPAQVQAGGWGPLGLLQATGTAVLPSHGGCNVAVPPHPTPKLSAGLSWMPQKLRGVLNGDPKRCLSPNPKTRECDLTWN